MKSYALALICVASLAHAELLNTGSNDYYMTPNTSYSTTVEPSSSAPQEQCWYEQVPISGASLANENPNVAGAVVGGIIGGIVGHQFGSGSGNTAATVAGAVIGTSIGAHSGEDAPSAPQYQLIRKCNTIR